MILDEVTKLSKKSMICEILLFCSGNDMSHGHDKELYELRKLQNMDQGSHNDYY